MALGRPVREPADRITTQIRLAPDLHERFLKAATERDVSFNWLACKALADFLDRLIPVDELVFTRRGED